MGVLLHLVTDTGEECPIAYSYQADPKDFCRKVTAYPEPDSEIALLLDYFGLDLEPLTKRSGEAYTLEQWLNPSVRITGDWDSWTDEMKRAAWQKHRAEIEASYQDPERFLAALNPFIEALAANPAVYRAVGIVAPYFTKGAFLLHLNDLRRKLEWAQNRGFSRVRLLVA